MKVQTVAFTCGMGLIAAGAVSNPAAAGHWYIAGQAGAVFLNGADVTLQSPSGLTAPIGTLHFDTGWGLGGSAGYGFDNGFRLEGEVTYRDNSISGLSGNPSSPNVSGNASTWAFMANGYYDIPTGGRWTPYIGGGIGFALDHLTVDASPSPGTVVDSTSTQFAYQGIAGIGYQITDSLNLALEYRYFGTMDPSYALNIPGVPAGIDLKTEYGSNNVMLKLRWNLN